MRPIRPALLAALALAVLGGPATVGGHAASPDPMPAAAVALMPATIERADALVRSIRDYEATWDEHDLQGFTDFLSDEGFVFVDMGHRLDGKQAFVDFMSPFLTDPEHVGASDRRFHVGADELIEPYQTWGFAGATEDDPLVQVDLFGVREGTITSPCTGRTSCGASCRSIRPS
jgi:hypothetical protein